MSFGLVRCFDGVIFLFFFFFVGVCLVMKCFVTSGRSLLDERK